MTLIFNRLLEVVKVHVHTKCHQAKCSVNKVSTMLKTILPSYPRALITTVVNFFFKIGMQFSTAATIDYFTT